MTWSTEELVSAHLSHDLPCLSCGHGWHSYLPCSDSCDCRPRPMPGADPTPVGAGPSPSGGRTAYRPR